MALIGNYPLKIKEKFKYLGVTVANTNGILRGNQTENKHEQSRGFFSDKCETCLNVVGGNNYMFYVIYK